MCCRVAKVLARKAEGDSLTAKKLAPCSEIDDGVIGFHIQQAVEKSLKSVLSMKDVNYPMMAHDLDFLLSLATENAIEIPPKLTDSAWLTPWCTTYENGEASPGTLDRQHTIEIGEIAVSWCRNSIAQAPSGPCVDRISDKPPPPPPSVPGLGRPETRGL